MRIFFVHWERRQAMPTVRKLRAAGHVVVHHWDQDTGNQTWTKFKQRPPGALVVSLDHLPSHGRRVAAVTKETKRLSEIPVVFVGGARDKLPAAKREFPRAKFTTEPELVSVLEEISSEVT